MADATLPTEIIVLILSWLPVKSLLRFTCVSKLFHSIILSYPKFAKSQFQAAHDRKTLDHGLLYDAANIPPRLVSLQLETTSSFRKLKYPFRPPAGDLWLLGSCNGIVFLAFDMKVFYVWNPSTGFFKELPAPGLSYEKSHTFRYGIGYLWATNEYKLVIASDQYNIFSSRAQAWKRLDVSEKSHVYSSEGTLSNESLHWVDFGQGLMVLDLAQDKFRKMALPYFDDCGFIQRGVLAVSAEGCLSFAYPPLSAPDCICVWVMKEYGVLDSWTKLFNFQILSLPEGYWSLNRVLVLGTSIVAHIHTVTVVDDRFCSPDLKRWITILHKEVDKCVLYEVEGCALNMLPYQESLLRFDH